MRLKFNDSQLEYLCGDIRKDVFQMILKANSGHLGGCSSSTELMASLYFGGILNYDPNNPFEEGRDRVLVRGHLGPLRYKIFSLLGWLDKSELGTYRSLGSRLQGHESMDLVPGVDITPSGSLGMGLSYGVGAALAAKRIGANFRVYTFLGDGEEQEGNVSEAARQAVKLSLDNLICILDRNKKQLSHPTLDVDCSDVAKIWEGYGWNVLRLHDGHNFAEIREVLTKAQESSRPAFVIADTVKGRGIAGCENSSNGYHTISSCSKEQVLNAITQLASDTSFPACSSRGLVVGPRTRRRFDLNIQPSQRDVGLEDATDIYLKQLESNLGNLRVRFYIMTADLVDQEYISSFKFSPTSTFVDVGIREQHLFASAHGISMSDPESRIWIHSGDSFLYRASDQLNAACQGKSGMIILGDRPGLGGGKNGPTHQSSGQPGLALTMPGLTFLEPADVDDLYNCFNYAVNEYSGPFYVRLHPAKINALPSEEPKNTDNYLVCSPSQTPHLNLVGSGLAMKYALDAVRSLDARGIRVSLVNVVNPKTLDDKFASKLIPSVPVLVLYNGNPFVLESAVSTAIMRSNCVRPSRVYSHGFEYGTSGHVEDLLRHFEFDCESIQKRIRGILA